MNAPYTNEMIEHVGFHCGFEAQLVGPPELLPDYPQPGDWTLLKEQFGDALDTDAEAAFVEGYRNGLTAEECPKCHGGVLGHKKFLMATYPIQVGVSEEELTVIERLVAKGLLMVWNPTTRHFTEVESCNRNGLAIQLNIDEGE